MLVRRLTRGELVALVLDGIDYCVAAWFVVRTV